MPGTRVKVAVTGTGDSDIWLTQRFAALHSPRGTVVGRVAGQGGRAFDALVARAGDPLEADVLVLLEAGCRVGPGWLDPLLAALSTPGIGLAGPSTNACWNEQGCVSATGSDLGAVRRDAAAAASRFDEAVTPMSPLHSLAAFCYAVRRDVVLAVGSADPSFGDGPCWEMDYNVRAARAGFAGVWVGSSYVYRSPVRVRDDPAALAAGRRAYQDRWCDLRSDGPRSAAPYRDHCEGEACEHFRRTPLGPPSPSVSVLLPDVPPAAPRSAEVGRAREVTGARGPVVTASSAPLVTCAMVTRDRPTLAARAVRQFLAQDYPHLELVVVEDGPPRLAGLLPRDDRIRLVSSGEVRSIGAMRNQSCALARGEVVVLWDDDDWHGPSRVSAQVAPIIEGRADLTGLTDLVWLDVAQWQAWTVAPAAQHELLFQRVYAGTLAFRRSVWGSAVFPDRSLAEDAAFLREALRRGHRLYHLDGAGLYVYVRHDVNSWRVSCGSSRPARGWLRADVPDLPQEDLAFLRANGSNPAATTPLVSCVMPTSDRLRFVERSVDYFLRQTYPRRELVVVDDGNEPVEDVVASAVPQHLPPGVTVRYHRLDRRTVLGAKRNVACSLAHGELVAHWDDDDWQAPDRLERQVARMTATGAAICGMATIDFYSPRGRRAWTYAWPAHRRPWVAGTSLVYTREHWERSGFSEVAQGEDTRFVWRAPAGAVVTTSERSIVAIVHPGNTVPKSGRGAYWRAQSPESIESVLGADLDFYLRVAEGLRGDAVTR